MLVRLRLYLDQDISSSWEEHEKLPFEMPADMQIYGTENFFHFNEVRFSTECLGMRTVEAAFVQLCSVAIRACFSPCLVPSSCLYLWGFLPVCPSLSVCLLRDPS